MDKEGNRQDAGATRRLYFEDPYRTEFEAEVLERADVEGKAAVILDQTCFYPESGGQPADRGELGGLAVVHVYEDGERIVHQLSGALERDRVRGVIDWARRFDHMQQHTGQHVLSQCFVEVLGGETRSFHLGENVSTLEIGIRDASPADIERVESRANDIVTSDLEVKTYFVPAEKIETVPLRRPPKKTGLIRVVEVSGFDFSACGGTHCRRTGEVGLIKILRAEKIRGNLRFEFLCGSRARRDYARKSRMLEEITQRLSAGEENIAAAVEKIAQELREAKKRLRRDEELIAGYEAREIIGRSTGPIITALWEEKSYEAAKILALNVIRAGDYAVLFGVRSGGREQFIFASSDGLPLNMRELIPVVQSVIRAKGGGSPTLVELIAEKGGFAEAVLEAAAAFLRAKLAT